MQSIRRTLRSSVQPSLLALLLLGASGCCTLFKICPPTPTPTSTPTFTPTPTPTTPPGCTLPSIDPDKSLVIHNRALLATPFNLRKTLEKIISTSGTTMSPTPSPEELLQTLLDTFNATSFTNPPITVPVSQRPAEAGQSAAALLDSSSGVGMVPVGLFNRFDLVPADGSNCGEYRIVYAKPAQGRFFIIFESKLPNPDPSTGIAGCLPVVQFWASLSAKSDSDRIIDLEKFYYDKLPGSSTFGPVVAHANYGIPFGQVRANFLVGSPWMLREYRTWIDPFTTRPIFQAATVKDTPLIEFYKATSTLPPGISAAQQQGWRKDFMNGPLCNLLRPDRVNPGATEFEIVNGIGAGFLSAGNDFESFSDDQDNPATQAEAPMQSAVTTRLGDLGVNTTNVNQEHALNRAGAMTCGGCHQFSNGKELNSTGAHWPSSSGFVHIDESGDLSTALTDFFLKRRQQIFERFLCDPTAEPQPTAACPTVAAPAATPVAIMAVGAPPPVASGLPAKLVSTLRRGRNLPSLRVVDDARLALIAAAQRAKKGPKASAMDAQSAVTKAAAHLDAIVRQTREEEAAKPGAFEAVRRTH